MKTVDSGKWQTAVDDVRKNCSEECIAELLDIWSQPFSQGVSITLACELARTPEAANLILQAVREAIAEGPNNPAHLRATAFFGKPARILASNLDDPRPVADLFMEQDRNITQLPLPPELMDEYVVRTLRAKDQPSEFGTGHSHALYVTSNAIAQLRVEFRAHARKAPTSEGALSFAETLAQYGDNDITPDLQSLAEKQTVPAARQRLDTLHLKLLTQNSADEKTTLMDIVRNEQTNSERLEYAICRLLHLGVNRHTLIETLGPSDSSAVRRHWVVYLRWPDSEPSSPEEVIARESANYQQILDVLDGEEFRSYRREFWKYDAYYKQRTAEEEAIMRQAQRETEFCKTSMDEWRRTNPDLASRLDEIQREQKEFAPHSLKYSLASLIYGDGGAR